MLRDLSRQSIRKNKEIESTQNHDLKSVVASRPQSGKYFSNRQQSANGPRPPLHEKKDANFRHLLSNRQM
jgi:hypothetical protein